MANRTKAILMALSLLMAPPLLLSPGFVPPAHADMADAAGELAYWNRIKNSSSAAAFKAYLDQYPNGMFSDLAMSKYRSLSGSGVGTPKTKPMMMKRHPRMPHVAVHKPHKHVVHKKRIKRKRAAAADNPNLFLPSGGGGGGGGSGHTGGWGH